jgi:hypothetical protein
LADRVAGGLFVNRAGSDAESDAADGSRAAAGSGARTESDAGRDRRPSSRSADVDVRGIRRRWR